MYNPIKDLTKKELGFGVFHIDFVNVIFFFNDLYGFVSWKRREMLEECPLCY